MTTETRGGLDPALYDPRMIAGYGFSVYDYEPEPRQPPGWQAGMPPSWERVWLGER